VELRCNWKSDLTKGQDWITHFSVQARRLAIQAAEKLNITIPSWGTVAVACHTADLQWATDYCYFPICELQPCCHSLERFSYPLRHYCPPARYFAFASQNRAIWVSFPERPRGLWVVQR